MHEYMYKPTKMHTFFCVDTHILEESKNVSPGYKLKWLQPSIISWVNILIKS